MKQTIYSCDITQKSTKSKSTHGLLQTSSQQALLTPLPARRKPISFSLPVKKLFKFLFRRSNINASVHSIEVHFKQFAQLFHQFLVIFEASFFRLLVSNSPMFLLNLGSPHINPSRAAKPQLWLCYAWRVYKPLNVTWQPLAQSCYSQSVTIISMQTLTGTHTCRICWKPISSAFIKSFYD